MSARETAIVGKNNTKAEVTGQNELKVQVSSVAGGGLEVTQANHDNLNTNANLQIGDADVSNLNPVPVTGTFSFALEGLADAGNSSDTPLLAGASFTGAAIDIKDYAAINVAVFSDVNAATNGLRMEFSPDGVNWDHTHTFNVIGNIGVSYAQAAELRYFRIVYVNGGTDQTVFRLTTILKLTTVSPSRYTVEQPLIGNQMADVVKSVIFGKTTAGGGAYVDVKVNPSGALTVEADIVASVLPTGAATETTLSSVDTKLNALIRIPNLLRVTTNGTIAVNVYDFSVANVGVADGTILGSIIKPGEILNFGAGAFNNYYAASTITYDGTGTELVIIYNS
jgi:hypothetical protein